MIWEITFTHLQLLTEASSVLSVRTRTSIGQLKVHACT